MVVFVLDEKGQIPDSVSRAVSLIRGSRLAMAALLMALIILFVVGLLAYSSIIWGLIKEQLGGQSFGSFVPPLINTIILIFGTLVFLAITRFFIARYLENRGKKKEIKLILTLYSYIVWILTIILILSTWFKDIGIFLASLGLIGFGLTFALQKPILNFVGWLVLVINKPFNIGDRIEVAGNRGDVISIHAMYTSLQGTRVNSQEKSEKIITFPNEFILTNPVLNYTKRADLFWEDFTVQITYESNWKKAERVLFEVTSQVANKYVMRPVQTARKDPKAFEDVIHLLQEASKKLSRGMLKESIRENIETMKTIEQKSHEEIPVPSIRVDLLDSSIGLNVLFLADIHKIRVMRGEISRGFLTAIERQSDIEIAYPHLQVVYDPRRRSAKNNLRLNELVPNLDDFKPP